MKSYFTLNNRKLHYSDQGEGDCLVFLHGYLESLDIWGSFADGLSVNYRMICLDLPGHGKSQELSESYSMEQLAELVFLALKKLKVKKCFMPGHSMGGYVTLMFHFFTLLVKRITTSIITY